MGFNETWNILSKRQKKMMGISETKVPDFMRMKNNNQDKLGFAFEKVAPEVETYIQRVIREKRDIITLEDLTKQGVKELMIGRNLGDLVRFVRHPRVENKRKLPKGLQGKTIYQARLLAKKNNSSAISEYLELVTPQLGVATKTATSLVLHPLKSIPNFLGISEETAREGIKIFETIKGAGGKKHKKMSIRRTGRTIQDIIKR
ncbi:MAG TPA: hypothetical protein VMZ29_09285 [Candidatus Bathyarchaeia archaeon]|nr:hypothetical protein [Candidatus Bathyarchaeia archaeon]